jgi:hypothetical protein
MQRDSGGSGTARPQATGSPVSGSVMMLSKLQSVGGVEQGMAPPLLDAQLLLDPLPLAPPPLELPPLPLLPEQNMGPALSGLGTQVAPPIHSALDAQTWYCPEAHGLA